MANPHSPCPRPLLKIMACGSVDDGKSTLLGHLFHGLSKAPPLPAGHTYADLLDGLMAEREQGITIDVAHRFFDFEGTRLHILDTPGHEMYTKNMATAASIADLALVLVDARRGITPQTLRHTALCAVLGVPAIALVVNKMDLAGYDEEVFETIWKTYQGRTSLLSFPSPPVALPLSATTGETLFSKSPNMAWYQGPSLLGYLAAQIKTPPPEKDDVPLLPIQWVNRPHQDFRGVAGTLVSGTLHVGQDVVVLPQNVPTQVSNLVVWPGERTRAEAGQAITVTLTPPIEAGRGSVVTSREQGGKTALLVEKDLEVTVIWFAPSPLVPGRLYTLLSGTQTRTGSFSPLKRRLDLSNLSYSPVRSEDTPSSSLNSNEIGQCALHVDAPLTTTLYAKNRLLGGLMILDRLTGLPLGLAVVDGPCSPSTTRTPWQPLTIGQDQRAHALGQNPGVFWFTGLSGSGKSTLANLLETHLHAEGFHTYLLDGDNLRNGLTQDLGFSDQDRVENARRIAETARLMVDAGLIVLVCTISPFQNERLMARERLSQKGFFLEIFVDTPLELCEKRDPKGLYARARSGEIGQFTGISSAYEPPTAPDIHVTPTPTTRPEDSLEELVPHCNICRLS